ncbi:MAG: hypothetical protein AB7I27_04385 [Bacteriovoracaceae bacterium]
MKFGTILFSLALSFAAVAKDDSLQAAIQRYQQLERQDQNQQVQNIKKANIKLANKLLLKASKESKVNFIADLSTYQQNLEPSSFNHMIFKVYAYGQNGEMCEINKHVLSIKLEPSDPNELTSITCHGNENVNGKIIYSETVY